MKFSFLLALFLSVSSLSGVEIQQADDLIIYEPTTNVGNAPQTIQTQNNELRNSNSCGQELLEKNSCVRINVLGQGVAPVNTASPAQAYAMAKRAAIADSYRLIAEKIKGVRVDGQDLIKNMMVKRSTVRTSVCAMVKNANVVETTFKEGLCEVEMEILIYHSQFSL
ncbi:MAG: hypothetical protein U9P72_08780 [Campylobacterota bacterium]|nr:hypothetical protein [Campylobacterota bacterium]